MSVILRARYSCKPQLLNPGPRTPISQAFWLLLEPLSSQRRRSIPKRKTRGVRVVHLGWYTCHAVHGQGCSSTRIPHGCVRLPNHLPWSRRWRLLSFQDAAPRGGDPEQQSLDCGRKHHQDSMYESMKYADSKHPQGGWLYWLMY